MTPDQIDALVENNRKLQHQLTCAFSRIKFLTEEFEKGIEYNKDLRRHQVKLDDRIQNLETEVRSLQHRNEIANSHSSDSSDWYSTEWYSLDGNTNANANWYSSDWYSS